MAKSDRQSIVQLAKVANLDVDDALIKLWDKGFNDVKDQTTVLSGPRLNAAKSTLGIATKRQLTSLAYWKSMLNLDEKDFREKLESLNIPVSKNSKTLPQGAIRKLSNYSGTRHQLVLNYEVPHVIELLRPKIHFKWRTVGRQREVRYVTIDDVYLIHGALVADFLNHQDPIDPPGIRSVDLLESAIFRQHTSFGEVKKYPTVEMVAAALLHSLVLNHAFYNGNKRTALVTMLVLLDMNGLILTCDEHSLFKFILKVAQHSVVEETIDHHDLPDAEVVEMAEWIRGNSRLIDMKERPLPYRKLQQILTTYGCTFEHSSNGCNVKISKVIERGGLFRKPKVLVSHIAYGNEGRIVSKPTIKKVREELQLTEENGIDSALFYGDVPFIVDEFINKYRKTLHRLSKL